MVRDSPRGLETFLTGRPLTMEFAPGFHVFPGGRVDPEDSHTELLARLTSFDTEQARQEVDSGPLEPGAYWAGGFREMFEESGVILASRSGQPLTPVEMIELDRDYRMKVQGGDLSFREFLGRTGLELPAPRLRFFDHWVTPDTQPRRFDTRFFLVVLHEPVEPVHTPGEAVSSLWIRPKAALQAFQDEELKLLPPTYRCLVRLSHYSTTDELLKGFPSDEFARSLEQRRAARQGPKIG